MEYSMTARTFTSTLRPKFRPGNLMVAAPALLLGACGGSIGPSSATSQQPVSVPLRAAVASQVENGTSTAFSVTGTMDAVPVTGSGTLVDSAPTPATFNGAAVLQTAETFTETVVQNGVSIPITETKQILTDPATFAEVGAINNDGTVDVIPPYTYPPSVVPGDSGTLATGTEYSDKTMQQPVGSVDISYSVASDTSTTDVVDIDRKVKDKNNNEIKDDDKKIRIDKNGDCKPVSQKEKGSHNGHQDDFDDEDED
ncbi:hypothetical protein EVC45_09015 [Paraburkholderia sp. UYCP14C]|uniref:hypothetical protein n=1 Tax=Paraburkholderia sp. UYCP14C TaxID=2511130 RepID=UPI0010224199|nr:hypothetical protein [Paraburkholderia sp. UYCP14C]RZF30142.1 hypothetical protein EVC45_09015 [Paraburkholderia sp. UYCP14C]